MPNFCATFVKLHSWILGGLVSTLLHYTLSETNIILVQLCDPERQQRHTRAGRDICDQSAAFQVFLALRTLRANLSWHVTCQKRLNVRVNALKTPGCNSLYKRGHCSVVVVWFIMSMFRIEGVKLRVSMLTMKNLSQPAVK